MRRSLIRIAGTVSITLISVSLNAQKTDNSCGLISSSKLRSHVSFLASPLLRGRMNGEEGMEIAGQYIATQARLTGLKPANGNSYFQPYNIIEKTIDREKTTIQIISGALDTVKNHDSMFQLVPTGPADYTLEGEVVFAGYGIKAEKLKYNDFENISTEGKILLIMDRAPLSEDGKKLLFDDPAFSSDMNFQAKLTTLFLSKAKAVLIVSDPKSGYNSLSESDPGLAAELNSKKSLPGEKEDRISQFLAAMPKVIFIHRSVADELLKGSGHTLEDLQKDIDRSLKSNSFLIPGKQIMVNEVTMTRVKVLNNIAGYIEGSDPVQKNEVVVFSGHYDHIGGSGKSINAGADDNASGCAALLQMAEAFQSLEKKPRRSILFLWVSGEEIGLYGSESYVKNPLFPLEMTVADLNMDMIGRVKGIADSTDETPMSGPDNVFVITDNQSSELLSIARDIDRQNKIDFDYSLSGTDHPLQLFSRSDHYNFVKEGIPVLFFTTGLHSDYHTPRDVIENLDFEKMEMVTRAMYEIGLTIANRKNRLVVDNPYGR